MFRRKNICFSLSPNRFGLRGDSTKGDVLGFKFRHITFSYLIVFFLLGRLGVGVLV